MDSSVLNVRFIIPTICLITLINVTGTVGQFLLVPDFTSPWYPLSSGDASTARIDVLHGLGETPLLVDVQVKAIDGPNKGFIFPAVGVQPRDDDAELDYGAVVYLYNEEYVKISAPVTANHYLGSVLFTGAPPYWNGPNFQKSYSSHVRVRAWKQSTLPSPDFSLTGRTIEAKSSDANKVFIEVNHELSDYPALVVVRTKLLDKTSPLHEYMSDSVGSTLRGISYSSQQSAYVIFGVSDDMFRIWVPAVKTGCSCVYGGGDGHGLDGAFKTGELDIFAWKSSTVALAEEGLTTLATSVHEASISVNTMEDDMFIRIWAESINPPNTGFRFIGSGSLAYSLTATTTPCSYGGLTYSYTNTTIRFWEPAVGSAGSVICISDEFGAGKYSQSSNRGSMIYSVWRPDFDECTTFPCENNGTCINGNHTYWCNCTDGWTGSNCDIDVDECNSNPCLHNGTCVDDINMFTCFCDNGWTGTYCDVDVDECETKPCQENSTCINGRNRYTCICTDDWMGYNCSTAIAHIEPDNSVLIGLTAGLSALAVVLVCVLAILYTAKKNREKERVWSSKPDSCRKSVFRVPKDMFALNKSSM